MDLGRRDLLWNYGASFMRVASALIILPLILKMLSPEDYGLWSIMLSIKAITELLDFGFSPTFSRAVTYVYSGAKSLRAVGFDPVVGGGDVNYSLLGSLIKAVKRFYGGVAIILLLFLGSAGLFYLEHILSGYRGDLTMARISWYAYGALLCYQFYTYYYDSMLVGRGMIRRARQIVVLSQSLHIVVASIMLSLGYGIVSMVSGQIVSVLVNRILAYKAFYDKGTLSDLRSASPADWITTLRNLWSTAYKSGLTGLSWIVSNRMLAAFAGLYIPLSLVGDYGLSKQVAEITYTLSVVWFVTFYPKITQHKISNNKQQLRRMYYKALIIASAVFIICLSGVLILGDTLLEFIGSRTHFISLWLLVLLMFSALFDGFTYISTSVLLAGNEVPHYKAQLITAVFTVLILFLFLHFTDFGLVAIVMVPFGSNLLYNHWKWASVVISSFKKETD